jgi:transposase
MNPRLTPTDARLIRYVYAQGLRQAGLQRGEHVKGGRNTAYISMRELAEHYGVSVCTISNIINGRSYTGAPRRDPVMPSRDPTRPERARQLWRAGWTTRQIATELGITHSAVWYSVKRIPAPPKRWTRRSRRLLATSLAVAEAT